MSSTHRTWITGVKRTVSYCILLSFLAAVGFAGYYGYRHITRLDRAIISSFNTKRWTIPASVYARPLELYPDLPLTPDLLVDELELAGYRNEPHPTSPGGYHRTDDVIRIVTRSFVYPTGIEESTPITVTFTSNAIAQLKRTDSGEEIPLIRLDPAKIGSFHPRENKDRLLVSREDVPQLLLDTLLVVEDKKFFQHKGISLPSIVRALLVNLKAGRTVQGGSTLTQQLVKNFFLTNERSLNRKINEAIMAALLERHYDKDQILNAYLNEIYLGQDGARAIHGFGLASNFYFRRALADLTIGQIATLVGMVKGPSAYDPRSQAKKCRYRRNAVLTLMLSNNLIDESQYHQALAAPLIYPTQMTQGMNRFPAFMDIVREQLLAEYREEDLTSNGLQILTTLDPHLQIQVEKQLQNTLHTLEKRSRTKNLEGSAIITNKENGEILALAGGRHPLAGNFNRALSAKRPLGSLIKPAIYLTALAHGYELDSTVVDEPITWREPGGTTWQPQNFDKATHGRIPLYQALSKSYNLAAIKTGFSVGLDNVIQTAKALGLSGDFPRYPSFFLGAATVTPIAVTQMYQTLASGGFYLPLRAINSVISGEGKELTRFSLEVEQRFPPEYVFLINYCLQQVIRNGTGTHLAEIYTDWHGVAGKTGTSNDLRDSWFAGFTGNKLGVIWVGRDDNKPAGLTGSSGAMVVWANIFKHLPSQPLQLIEPPHIAYRSAWFGDYMPVIDRN